eukprot:5227115-Pyramimonas_sp.AAC.1
MRHEAQSPFPSQSVSAAARAAHSEQRDAAAANPPRRAKFQRVYRVKLRDQALKSPFHGHACQAPPRL